MRPIAPKDSRDEGPMDFELDTWNFSPHLNQQAKSIQLAWTLELSANRGRMAFGACDPVSLLLDPCMHDGQEVRSMGGGQVERRDQVLATARSLPRYIGTGRPLGGTVGTSEKNGFGIFASNHFGAKWRVLLRRA